MTNNQQDPQDATLNRAIIDLDWEMQPEHDLWPLIGSAIRFTPQKAKRRSYWPQMAIAASVLLTTGALVFSFMSYQRSDQTQQLQAQMVVFQQGHIAVIEQQHALVRAQLTSVLAQSSEHINPQLAIEIKAVLSTIDAASLEIKSAIEMQPFSTGYASMLARTYQRENRILNQLTTEKSTSI